MARGHDLRLSTSADFLGLGRPHAEIDILIADGRPPCGAGLTVGSLGPEEITALCTPEVARALGPVTAGTAGRFTRLDSSFSPVRWPDWLAHNRLAAADGAAGAAIGRGSVVISAAVQGLRVALESLRFAERERAAGQLVRLDQGRVASLTRDLHVIHARERDGALAKIQAFRRWLLDAEAASRAGSA